MIFNSLFVYVKSFIEISATLLEYAIIIRVIMSWINMGNTSVGRFSMIINDVTDPIMNFCKIFPHRIGMLDLSPIIALFGIQIMAFLLISALDYLAVLL